MNAAGSNTGGQAIGPVQTDHLNGQLKCREAYGHEWKPAKQENQMTLDWGDGRGGVLLENPSEYVWRSGLFPEVLC